MNLKVVTDLWTSTGSKAFCQAVCSHLCSAHVSELDPSLGHLMHPQCLHTYVTGAPGRFRIMCRDAVLSLETSMSEDFSFLPPQWLCSLLVEELHWKQ